MQQLLRSFFMLALGAVAPAALAHHGGDQSIAGGITHFFTGPEHLLPVLVLATIIAAVFGIAIRR